MLEYYQYYTKTLQQFYFISLCLKLRDITGPYRCKLNIDLNLWSKVGDVYYKYEQNSYIVIACFSIPQGYKKANITFYVSCKSIHLTYFLKYFILILFPCIRISIHCSMHQKSSCLCICCNIIRHMMTCCVVYYFKEYFMNQARISSKTSQFNQLYYQCD